MRWSHQLQLRVRSLLRRGLVDRELEDELRFHIEQQINENLMVGMVPDEARDAAHRAVGCLTQIQEDCRAMRRIHWIEELMQDFRYAVRALHGDPGSTSTAVLMLTLGIGAITAVFSMADATLIRPIPYADASKIVELARTAPRFDHPVPLSGADFLDWRVRSQTFAGMAAYTFSSFTRMSSAGPQRAYAGRVSASFFSVLGVRPALGRAFLPNEDQSEKAPVVLLSARAWQQWFGADGHCLGQTLLLNGQSYTVVGVLPSTFKFPGATAVQVWTPL